MELLLSALSDDLKHVRSVRTGRFGGSAARFFGNFGPC